MNIKQTFSTITVQMQVKRQKLAANIVSWNNA
jgi:hypothetical protein